MVLNEKPTKNMKLRGLRYYQIGTPNYIYQNDQHKNINTFNDFERETPHAISKIWRKF